MSITVMKQALEEYELDQSTENHGKLMLAVRQAIAEAEKQEPVANYCKECLTYNGHHEGCSHYTSPPQRQWVGLTDDEMWNAYTGGSDIINLDYAKAIEAKLKEKNT